MSSPSRLDAEEPLIRAWHLYRSHSFEFHLVGFTGFLVLVLGVTGIYTLRAPELLYPLLFFFALLRVVAYRMAEQYADGMPVKIGTLLAPWRFVLLLVLLWSGIVGTLLLSAMFSLFHAGVGRWDGMMVLSASVGLLLAVWIGLFGNLAMWVQDLSSCESGLSFIKRVMTLYKRDIEQMNQTAKLAVFRIGLLALSGVLMGSGLILYFGVQSCLEVSIMNSNHRGCLDT